MLLKRVSWAIGMGLVWASGGCAASITTSTTCSFPGAVTVSDPLSCSLTTIEGQPFHEEASVAASVSVSGNSAIINVDTQARVIEFPSFSALGASAEAVASIDLILDIAGPPRSGFVSFATSVSACPGNSTITVSLPGVTDADFCRLVPFVDYDFPTTIGGVFPIAVFARSAARGGANLPHDASELLRFNLFFYNQDPSIPVQVTDVTPEPSTARLCLIPLVVIACWFMTAQGGYAKRHTTM